MKALKRTRKTSTMLTYPVMWSLISGSSMSCISRIPMNEMVRIQIVRWAMPMRTSPDTLLAAVATSEREVISGHMMMSWISLLGSQSITEEAVKVSQLEGHQIWHRTEGP